VKKKKKKTQVHSKKNRKNKGKGNRVGGKARKITKRIPTPGKEIRGSERSSEWGLPPGKKLRMGGARKRKIVEVSPKTRGGGVGALDSPSDKRSFGGGGSPVATNTGNGTEI